MASWTDRIPNFNPYVEQQPVDAMLKVGMYKQQKYEEGVQKIQTAIDNVAGLDIASELDKKYLQSKLNGLGNNLNIVAGADFSNFQLVNSVNGMTKEIVKDQYVQNAVSSTARIRKNQRILEADEKAGKSSVQNRAKFEEGVGQYINKIHLKDNYNGKYVRYIDIDKKMRDVADKVHEIDNTIEDPFKRDSSGRHILDSQGRPIPDDAILRITTKGKPAEKILSNFYSALNENDVEQLRIDSWYHYRGKTANDFKQDAVSNYETSKQMLNDRIIQQNVRLSTSPNLTTAEKNKIEADINDANALLTNGSLDKQLDEQFAQIDANKDIEDYKYKLYTQKTLSNLAKDMSWQSYEQEYKANPYAQMLMERKRLQFQYDNAARDQKNKDREFGWDQYKWNIEQAQKAEAAKALKDGSLPPVTNQAISTDVDTPSLGKLNTEILAITGQRTPGGKIITPGAIDTLTNSYLDKVTKASLTTPQQKATYLDYLSKEYAKNPDKLIKALGNPNLAQYLEKRRALEITAAQKQALFTSTQQASSVYDEQARQLLGSYGGVTYSNGKTMYTANELYSFNKDLGNYYKTTGGGNASPTTGVSASQTSFDAKGLLNAYKGRKEEALAKAFVKRYYGQTLTATEKILVDRSQHIKFKFDPLINKIHQDKQKFETEFLGARMPERQVQVGTLDYAGNKADQKNTISLIGNKINEFDKLGQVDVNKWGDFNPEKLNTLRESKNVSYIIEKNYDGTGKLVVTDGKNKQTIPMTAGELSKFYPRIAQTNPWSDIKNEVLASPHHTTNISGTGDDSTLAVNARLSGYTAPHLANTSLAPLVRFDVEGAADNNGGDDDAFILKMYVNNNGIWKTGYVGSRFTSLASIQEQVKQIGPGTVSDFLKINK
jgi:hypothetical protein